MTNPPAHAKLTIKLGPGEGQVFELTDKDQVLGRTAPADLVIVHPEISKRHARISFKDGKYLLEDLGSSNGTFVRGQSIQGQYELSNGDEIFLGPNVVLIFNLQQPRFQSLEELVLSKDNSKAPRSEMTLLDAGSEIGESVTCKTGNSS